MEQDLQDLVDQQVQQVQVLQWKDKLLQQATYLQVVIQKVMLT